MKNKSGMAMYEIIIHIALIALLFALFFISFAGSTNSRGVKQQVLEKEIVLAVDSANSGMTFVLDKKGKKGVIDNIEIKDGKILVYIDGLGFSKGYPYFSRFSVSVRQDENKFYVEVR